MKPIQALSRMLAAASIVLGLPGHALAQSTNADLSDLVPSAGTLSPVFDSATTSYTATVTASSITLTPTAADALATITVNGDPVVSGNASELISLNFGDNVIDTVVTAEDTVTTKTYTLTITRNVPPTIATAPVAYWPMRDGLSGQTVPTSSGAIDDVIDNAGHPATNGTVNNNNSTWQADPTRGIVWSTVEGNRITAGQQGINLNTQSGWTWSIWAKIASSNNTDSGADVIMGSRNATWNKLDIGGASSWINPTFGAAGNPANDTWQHIVFVGDTTGGSIYVNGVFQNKDTTFNGGALSTAIFDDPMEIGGSSRFSEDLTALMSDVAVWDVALTPEQIADLAAGANVITDTTAPVLAATTPTDDDTNASTVLLQAIFDEPVFVGSGDIRIINLTDTVTTTLDVTDANQVTVSGASLTLNPSTALIVGKSYAIEIDAGAVTNAEGLDFAGILDQTTWNFTVDNTPPTLVSIEDSVGGGPIGEDIAFYTYTVTFNEPMDGAAIDETVFDNAGTATIDIGTVTQVSPTVFTVQVLPTSTGTVILRIPTGETVTDLSGNALVVPVTDDTTITIDAGETPSAPSSNRWWDGPTTSGVTDGVSQGGSGNWSTSNTNWDRGLGFEGPVAWDNAKNDIAILGGANGTVTLGEPITVGGLQIDNRNIDIVNSTLTFGVAGEINSTSVGNQNDPPIISSKISGAAISKTGAGYLSLTNNNNDFASFTLSEGTLGQLPGGIYTGIGTGLFTINGGGMFVTNNDQTTINNDMVWNGSWFSQNVSNGAKINEWNGNVTLGASIQISSKHAQVFNGDISEIGGARKLTLTNSGGSSTITLAGDNSFSGGLQINQGRLNINSATAIGSGTLTLNSTSVVLNNTSGNPITLSTNNVQAWNQNFAFDGTNDLNLGTGAVTMNNNRTVTVNAGTLTVGGAIGQSGGDRTLTKSGDGTLVLEGINSYAGNTTVSAGTLALVGGSQNSAIIVNNLASLGFTLGSPTTSSKAVTLNAGHSIIITGSVDNSSDYLLMTATAFTGTPTLSGIITDYELQLRESDTELWLAYIGTAASPYDTWAATFAPADLSDPQADNDSDGLLNIQEFAFGTDPTAATGAITLDGAGNVVNGKGTPIAHLQEITETGVDFRAIFSRRKDHVEAGLVYTVQFSTELDEWVDYTFNVDEPILLDGTDPDIDVMYVPFPLAVETSNGFEKPHFVRVGVEFAP